jgi:hypothetical protein
MSTCQCIAGTPPAPAETAQPVTLPLAEINHLVARSKEKFVVAKGESLTPLQEFVHAMPTGDRLYSASYSDAPGRGRVTHYGHVGLLPVQFVQRIDADESGLIHLSFEMMSPFRVPPATWTYQTQGGIFTLIDLPELDESGPEVPVPEPGQAPPGIESCVLKCVAPKLVSGVTACFVTAFLAGPFQPAAFVLCIGVTLGKSGFDAVECFAKCGG